MKKLITLLLVAISFSAIAQQTQDTLPSGAVSSSSQTYLVNPTDTNHRQVWQYFGNGHSSRMLSYYEWLHGSVNSFNGRSGSVVPQANDYSSYFFPVNPTIGVAVSHVGFDSSGSAVKDTTRYAPFYGSTATMPTYIKHYADSLRALQPDLSGGNTYNGSQIVNGSTSFPDQGAGTNSSMSLDNTGADFNGGHWITHPRNSTFPAAASDQGMMYVKKNTTTSLEYYGDGLVYIQNQNTNPSFLNIKSHGQTAGTSYDVYWPVNGGDLATSNDISVAISGVANKSTTFQNYSIPFTNSSGQLQADSTKIGYNASNHLRFDAGTTVDNAKIKIGQGLTSDYYTTLGISENINLPAVPGTNSWEIGNFELRIKMNGNTVEGNRSRGLKSVVLMNPNGYTGSSISTTGSGLEGVYRVVGPGTLNTINGGYFRTMVDSAGVTVNNAIGIASPPSAINSLSTIVNAIGVDIPDQNGQSPTRITNMANLLIGGNFGSNGLQAPSSLTGNWSIYNYSAYQNYFGGGLSFASTAGTGAAWYNTVDQTTNVEKVMANWSGNVFQIGDYIAGTGATRSVRLGNSTTTGGSSLTRYIGVNNPGSLPLFELVGGNLSAGGNVFNAGNFTLIGSSTMQNALGLNFTVNATGSEGYRGIFESVYEQALGSGNHLLADLGVNTAANAGGTHTSKFTVDDLGNTSFSHLRGISGTPTVVAGVGAGTLPTVTISGNDMSGTITVTAGTSPTAGATIATITFSAPYTAAPRILLQKVSTNTPADLETPAASTTAFTLMGTLAASTTYTYNYFVVQ